MANNVNIIEGPNTYTILTRDVGSGVQLQLALLSIDDGSGGYNVIGPGTAIPAAITSMPAGSPTAANQATTNTSLSSIDGKLTGVATAARQDTGNSSLQTIATQTNRSAGLIGAQASGAMATTSNIINMAQYRASRPTLTDTQFTNLQCNSVGGLIVDGGFQGPMAHSMSAASITTSSATILPSTANLYAVLFFNPASNSATVGLRTDSGTATTGGGSFILTPGASLAFGPTCNLPAPTGAVTAIASAAATITMVVVTF